MSQKMRPGRLLAALCSLLLVGWVGWNALDFLPEVWAKYRAPDTIAEPAALDTTLFQGDSGISLDTATLSQDTSLIGLLTRLGPRIGVSRRTTGAIHGPAGDLPLYSLVLHRGQPLPEIVAHTLDSLLAAGFSILESTENPRGRWPWACRLAREGKAVAILRARVGADPAAGAFSMGFVFWADSLSTGELGALALLPEGSVLALPAKALVEPRLLALARTAKLRLALLVRLETSRFPVVRQESTRLLLHHKDTDLDLRMEIPPDSPYPPEGLVVVDGDRGASDPGLSQRIAEFCRKRSLWLLDATGTSSSRLSQAALDAGASILPETRSGGSVPLPQALELAQANAEKSGQTLLVWPFDSASAERVGASVPLFHARGIETRSPQPLQRHQRQQGTGD